MAVETSLVHQIDFRDQGPDHDQGHLWGGDLDLVHALHFVNVDIQGLLVDAVRGHGLDLDLDHRVEGSRRKEESEKVQPTRDQDLARLRGVG